MIHTTHILTNSPQETEALGSRLARNCRGGEVIELVSDLGGGKTTFTRGFVRGLESSDTVASPTFTISREYQTPDHTVHHFDFYRLDEPGIMRNELAETLEDPTNIVVIEWADNVVDILPSERVTITFRATADSARDIEITIPNSNAYLLKDLS